MSALIDQPWFVIGPPWGDGTWVNAGSADPHGGSFVLDCVSMADMKIDKHAAAAIAEHIVKVHNTDLARRIVERKMGVGG